MTRRSNGEWQAMGRRVAALAALAGLAFAGSAAAQKVTIKMATLVPQGSAWHTTLQEMAQKWQAASNGQVTMRLYGGGVAGDDSDVVRKMRLGTLDAGVITTAGLSEIDRAVNALGVPLMFTDYAEYDAIAAQMLPEIEKVYAAKGFVVLAWADAGWVHLFTKNPVRTPSDLKAQKIFAWGNDGETVELWKGAGFNPVPLPATEISTALQTGLVTALPTTPQAAVLLQWYNHAKFMSDLPWAVLAGAIVINRTSWEKIPAEARPALAEAAREAAARLSAATRTGAKEDVAAMSKRGLTVVAVDAAAAAAWRDLAVSLYPKLRGKYAPPEYFDRALKLRDERRSGAR